MNTRTLEALASGEPIYTLSEVVSLVERHRARAAQDREDAVLEAVEVEVERLRDEIAEFTAGAALRLVRAHREIEAADARAREAARSAVDSAEFARQGWAEVARLRRAVDTHSASPCAKSSFDRDLYEVAAR